MGNASLPMAVALLAVCLLAVAAAVAWLAFELRMVRCGKLSPRTLEVIAPTDRMSWSTNTREDYV